MREAGAMGEVGAARDGRAGEVRVRYVERAAAGDAVLMVFKDPAARYAVVGEGAGGAIAGAGGDSLDVMVAPAGAQMDAGRSRALAEWLEKTGDADAAPPVYVKLRGVEAMWRPGRAVLQCEAEQAEAMLAAVVEFSHYEQELRRLEDEIANGWGELEQDKGLAFDVTPKDLARSGVVGGRMARVLQQRMRYARIEPHLYEPGVRLTAAGQKLGEELRERARIESRLETVDAQIEVFEGVYEMASQRMGEYRAAREEHVLEWVIIVLLAAEAVLMAAQVVWRH
jgi:tetrahydromethanopterin S-methyltransferase subunit G